MNFTTKHLLNNALVKVSLLSFLVIILLLSSTLTRQDSNFYLVFFVVLCAILVIKSEFVVFAGPLIIYGLLSYNYIDPMYFVDSAKFYHEAFVGSYYGEGHLTTVTAVGNVYYFISTILGSKDPKVLVLMNILLHSLTVSNLLTCLNIKTEYQKNTRKYYFVALALMSPLILFHTPLLLKDFFSLYIISYSFVCFCRYQESGRKYLLFASLLLCLISIPFRVYAPIYFVMLVFTTGHYNRLYLPFLLFLTTTMFLYFGSETFLYLVYSFAAIFFVPNFVSYSNWIESPLAMLEGILLVLFFIRCLVFKGKIDYKFIKTAIYIFWLIAITYAFTSLFRVTFSAYESQGGYLADNFFRKKIAVTYILLYFYTLATCKRGLF